MRRNGVPKMGNKYNVGEMVFHRWEISEKDCQCCKSYKRKYSQNFQDTSQISSQENMSREHPELLLLMRQSGNGKRGHRKVLNGVAAPSLPPIYTSPGVACGHFDKCPPAYFHKLVLSILPS